MSHTLEGINQDSQNTSQMAGVLSQPCQDWVVDKGLSVLVIIILTARRRLCRALVDVVRATLRF